MKSFPSRFELKSEFSRFYYLRPAKDLYFAKTSDTKCEGYQAFKDFLRISEIQKLDAIADEALYWSVFGEPIDNTNGSCLASPTPLFPDLPAVVSMKYSAYLYSTDLKSSQALDQFVKKQNGTTFFLSQLQFAQAEALQCNWEFFSITDDFFWNEFGGSYYSIHEDLALLLEEYQNLLRILNAQSGQNSLENFMISKGILPQLNPGFWKEFKRNGKFALACDLSYVGNRRTYLTYGGFEKIFECTDLECRFIDRP